MTRMVEARGAFAAWRPIFAIVGLALFLAVRLLHAQDADGSLRLALVIARHGVRSPSETNKAMSAYAAEPWPEWSVTRGSLTPHGRDLMVLLGTYYRLRFTWQGLLSGRPAADRGKVFFRADNVPRTEESARAFARGLVADPGVDLHLWANDDDDPLFKPTGALATAADANAALAAVRARSAAAPETIRVACRAPLDELDRVLFGPSGRAPAGKRSPRTLPVSFEVGSNDRLVAIRGSLDMGARLAENLLLEYLEGMPSPGWGRLTEPKLEAILPLRELSFELTQRSLYPARVQASNLAQQILATLQQAVDERPAAGAFGSLSDRVVVVLGHDGNLANLGGLLGLEWRVGALRNPTLPGGAILFELWKHSDGKYGVRIYYVSQTLQQMRDAQVLSLEAPPVVCDIPSLGAAGQAGVGLVPFSALREQMKQAIDPRFVQR